MPLSLSVLAGANALQRIRDDGLSPAAIGAVFGASGAAKWLTIAGLDSAVFGQWLAGSAHTVHLFGTSVGAFKLAAAAQPEPEQALLAFAQAYIAQQYHGELSLASIERETQRILDVLLPTGAAEQILDHPRYRFHCGTVRCDGGLGVHHPGRQRFGMVNGFLRQAAGKKAQQGLLTRTVFSDPRAVGYLQGQDGFPTRSVALTADNLRSAITASGAIPVYMCGIPDIAGAPPGMYRDGGLLDYHPIPGNFLPPSNELVLYPHFYPTLTEAWFDKFYPWRKAAAAALSNVVLLAPSAEYVAALPGGRIPDRRDFVRLKRADNQRQSNWQQAVRASRRLGEEFLELTASGKIRQVVKPLAGS